MEMINANQVISVPIWQLLAFLGALTLCTLMHKSIGMVLAGFLFSINWVFLQGSKAAKTEGQEYTLLAFFFAFGLICALSIAWRLYKADHYE
jgi:hypothetical protein